jgi:hypothetical protein
MATDSTQERCPTCDSKKRHKRGDVMVPDRWDTRFVVCDDPWHGSQDVEGANRQAGVANRPEADVSLKETHAPSTVSLAELLTPPRYEPPATQEAEKALETLRESRHDFGHGMLVQGYSQETRARLLAEYDAALRSLRTQHTALENERDEALRRYGDIAAAWHEGQLQHTKDQERIEELERVLANLGVQLTAGGSGDPAGGEVE